MTSLTGFLLSGNLVAAQENTSNPNIILIYMDDMGYGDIGSTGAMNYQTPNIDKMASEGMRFTNFYTVSPICSASRAALLTGSYPTRIGITGALMPNADIGINSNEVTIAELLKDQGYATGMVGKWHLGDAQKFLPLQHGFDEYFGLPYSNDMWPVDYDGTPADSGSFHAKYFPPLPLIEGNETIEYLEDHLDQDRLTTRYTKKAVEFIERHKEQPFFLYFAHAMPHVPLGVSDKFRGKSDQGLYGDMMMEVDWSIGQLLQVLRDNEIEDNTLVIFTSDNGPWLNYGNHAGSAGGLREGKQTTWEGGNRVPAIIHWPKVVPAGLINNYMAATIDILPTIAAITGASLPDHKIDGVNISSLLKGEKNSQPRKSLYFYYNENDLQAVRNGKWKLVLPHKWNSYEGKLPGKDGYPGERHIQSTNMALYDLRRDPGERYNVIDQHPEVLEELMELVEEARQDLGDDLTDRKGENKREPGKL
ncbi:sulfatase family protein [Rhodohalobacter sp. 614A]|uniref:sulfatase family protein n=1 Tax=Rhodohalobacter sp. 614A TaxID=2908649 RepID=UPI001F308EB5|nr:sulfatase [Rhodohalobacter sp. 614A]